VQQLQCDPGTFQSSAWLKRFYFCFDKACVSYQTFLSNRYVISCELGHAVAQWLRHCATNLKVARSIPDGVTGFFIDIILPVALWP
jgi:hypothetical protein